MQDLIAKLLRADILAFRVIPRELCLVVPELKILPVNISSHATTGVISTWTGLRPKHIFYEHRDRYSHTCKLEYVYTVVTMLLVLDQ